jgi:hypothetical protein
MQVKNSHILSHHHVIGHSDGQQDNHDFGGIALDVDTNPPGSKCASFMRAKNKARQHASSIFKNKCSSLQTKMNLHKGRVRHSRLIVLSWIQCGAIDPIKNANAKSFKLIPKELGSSDCE